MAGEFQWSFRSLLATNRSLSGSADNQKRSQREQKEVSMLVSSRFTLLAAAAATLSLGLAPVAHATVSPVFEADFTSVTGTTINGTTGGTATSYSKNSYSQGSIGSANPFTSASGGYLVATETAGQPPGAGANISPTTGFNSWFTETGSGPGGADNTINGAFDFFYKSDVDSSTWSGSSARIMDVNWGSTGIRLVLISPAANELEFALLTQPSSDYGHFYLGDSSVNMTAGDLYHIAATVSTAPGTGDLTANLYIVYGNTAIVTAGAVTTTPVATVTVGPFTDPVTTGFGTSDFLFGQEAYGSSSPTTMSQEFDSLRIYNGVPTTFSALPIPEPVPLGLLAVGGAALLLVGRRNDLKTASR